MPEGFVSVDYFQTHDFSLNLTSEVDHLTNYFVEKVFLLLIVLFQGETDIVSDTLLSW